MVSRGRSSDARCCSVCVVMLDNFCLVSSRLSVLWRITFSRCLKNSFLNSSINLLFRSERMDSLSMVGRAGVYFLGIDLCNCIEFWYFRTLS